MATLINKIHEGLVWIGDLVFENWILGFTIGVVTGIGIMVFFASFTPTVIECPNISSHLW